MTLVPEDWEARLEAAQALAPRGEVDVVIRLKLSDGEIEASAYLGLSPAEYARRKVLMISDLSIQPAVVTVLNEVKPGVFAFLEIPYVSVKDVKA